MSKVRITNSNNVKGIPEKHFVLIVPELKTEKKVIPSRRKCYSAIALQKAKEIEAENREMLRLEKIYRKRLLTPGTPASGEDLYNKTLEALKILTSE